MVSPLPDGADGVDAIPAMARILARVMVRRKREPLPRMSASASGAGRGQRRVDTATVNFGVREANRVGPTVRDNAVRWSSGVL